ncbi:MAG TPA: hypothetical protein VE958_12305 [Bryobacteraceae bacterium]|nr:hypothetical protein [Bryobacteraceae bacterium]
MRYQRFDPPAFLNDFTTEQQRDDWSAEVSGYFADGVAYNEGFPGLTSQFYNPVLTETVEPFTEALIEWPGFPKLVKDQFPTDPVKAWRTAETGANAREQFMDEYLEWHVIRKNGKITRVSFTCETSQYYQFLAKTDPGKLLSIYQSLVDPAHQAEVVVGDLIVNGKYQPKNKWNTQYGAVHLIQPNNNLYAEVLIAAQACILRQRATGAVITDADELIKCSRYGEPGRASDPKIGADVNGLARDGDSISLRNPVALYITGWNSTGMKKPNGSPVGNYWTLRRGTPSPGPNQAAMGLHLVFEVPAAEGFVVGDIKIGTHAIEFGGQLAEKISVGLLGLASSQGQSNNPSFKCGVQPAPAAPPAPAGFGLAHAAASAAHAPKPPTRVRVAH